MNQLELFLTRKVHTTILSPSRLSFFFFNDTATTEIYTLSLHDALPIRPWPATGVRMLRCHDQPPHVPAGLRRPGGRRSLRRAGAGGAGRLWRAEPAVRGPGRHGRAGRAAHARGGTAGPDHAGAPLPGHPGRVLVCHAAADSGGGAVPDAPARHDRDRAA